METLAADARMLLCGALRIQPSQLIRVTSVNADDEDRFNQRALMLMMRIVSTRWWIGVEVGNQRSTSSVMPGSVAFG